MKDLIPAFFKTGIRGEKWIPAFQVVAKSPEKKGTTKEELFFSFVVHPKAIVNGGVSLMSTWLHDRVPLSSGSAKRYCCRNPLVQRLCIYDTN